MDCIICLDEDEASNMTTVCNHSFHQSCLDQWLISHNSCPYCRFILIKLPEYDGSIDEGTSVDDEGTSVHHEGTSVDGNSDSDSDSDYEDAYNGSLETIRENNEEELYNWCEAFEISSCTQPDSYESLMHYNNCYENIVHYSKLLA